MGYRQSVSLGTGMDSHYGMLIFLFFVDVTSFLPLPYTLEYMVEIAV